MDDLAGIQRAIDVLDGDDVGDLDGRDRGVIGAVVLVAAEADAAPKPFAALVRRVADLPPLRKLAAKAREDYGDTWSGGQIEKSLRKVLEA